MLNLSTKIILVFLVIISLVILGFTIYNSVKCEKFTLSPSSILTEPTSKGIFEKIFHITPESAAIELKNSVHKLSENLTQKQTMLFATPQLEDRHPIVFIPALGASRLEYTTNDDYKPPPHTYGMCSSSGNLWATADASVPFFETCFLDRFSVNLDKNGNIVNTNGVNVKATTGEGGSEEGSFKAESYLLYMLGIGVSASIYMDPFYEALTPLGYKDKVDLFSYGYDFRRIGDNNYTNTYFKYLKGRLESIFVKSNKKIILLSHSLGCPTTIYFLNVMGPQWSNKYIEKFVAFAPAWGGSIKTMKPILYGDNEGIPMTKDHDFNDAEKVMGGIMMCMPSPLIYKDDEIVVVEKSDGSKQSYTSSQLPELFVKSGHQDSAKLYQIFDKNGVIGGDDNVIGGQRIPRTLTDPEIEVEVIYSNCCKTAHQYTFSATSSNTNPFDNAPTITSNMAGDGTVPELSCTYPCNNDFNKWSNCNCNKFPREKDMEAWKVLNNFQNEDEKNPSKKYIESLTKFHSTFEHLPIIQNKDVINFAIDNFIKK